MDIGSKAKWPANKLSNFALSLFVIDGVHCASMEGFIQALKFKNVDMQREVCKLVGKAAKFKGKKKKWWNRPEHQQMFWLGKGMKAHGKEHLGLVMRALRAKFTQCDSARRALLATRDARLTHSIGKNDKTALKKNDFCRMLMEIREEIKLKEWNDGRQ